jgi:hypothetical protein
MSANDGVQFATPKPGSTPIIAPPCGCEECRPGPGIDFAARRNRTVSDVLSDQGVTPVFMKYCGECKDVVRVASIEVADYWSHICLPKGHTWRTEGKI